MTNTNLSGKHFIGLKRSGKNTLTFHAKNPATGEVLKPEYFEASFEEVHEAVIRAAQAFEVYQNISYKERAGFLNIAVTFIT